MHESLRSLESRHLMRRNDWRIKECSQIQGNLEDRKSLNRALEGIDVAYLVTDFRGPGGIEGELKQGRGFVDACQSVGLR